MIQFRDFQLIASDLKEIGTAAGVAGSFVLGLNKPALWAILLTTIWLSLAISLKSYKGFPLKKRVIPLVILAVWGGTFWYTIFESPVIENHHIFVSGFKPKTGRTIGYPLSFFITVKNSKIEKPQGYSVDRVEEIAA